MVGVTNFTNSRRLNFYDSKIENLNFISRVEKEQQKPKEELR